MKRTIVSRQLASQAGCGSQPGIGLKSMSLKSMFGSTPRRAALSITVALILASSRAQATVTLSFNDAIWENNNPYDPAAKSGTFYIGNSVSAYVGTSSACSNVISGSTCTPNYAKTNDTDSSTSWTEPNADVAIPTPDPVNPPASPRPFTLFSWGLSGYEQNSVVQATYTGAGATLASLGLSSSEVGLGPVKGPNSSFGGPYDPATGTGSMVAYEQPQPTTRTNRALELHNASEQRVDLLVKELNSDGLTYATKYSSTNQLVLGQLSAGDSSPYYSFPNNPPAAGTGGIVQYLFDTSFDSTDFTDFTDSTAPQGKPLTSGIELAKNDIIEFRFYESIWNNDGVGNNVAGRGFPDAYYGGMEVTFSPGSALEVTPNPLDTLTPQSLNLGNLRAGDDLRAEGSLVATNVGGDTLRGSFATPTGDTTEISFSDPAATTAFPSASGTPNFVLGAGEEQPRDYRFDASDVALGLNPLGLDTLGQSDSRAQDFGLTQQVTSDADVGPKGATLTVTGSAVGPVLGVSLNASDPLNPTQNFAYDATIDLGDIAVDGGALTRDLTLANLFGTAGLGELTTLSIYNIGLRGDDAALFSIVGNYDQAYDPNPDPLNPSWSLLASNISGDGPLKIQFDPNAIADFSTTLYFETDMNNPFHIRGICSAGTNSNIANGCLVFTLTGSGTSGGGSAPAPGSLLLFMAGALAYPLFGRRRNSR